MQEELNISSTSVVHHHIKELEKKGLLKKNPNNPNDYVVVMPEENETIFLNLYGLAECGPNGIILDGNVEDKIPVSAKLLGISLKDAFLVKARGDSMIPKINDGDLVVAVKNNNPQNNDIVVCVNNGEALIKKISFRENKIYLVSLNPVFEEFEANNEFFAVEGIVKRVISIT